MVKTTMMHDARTENRMTVRQRWDESDEIVAGDALLQQLLQIAVLCNDA